MLKRIRRLLGRRSGKAAEATRETPPAGTSRPRVHHGPKVAHWPIAASDLDPDAVKIVRRLTRFDQRAYFVGGCVRDCLLERKPKDFDIGTSATPRQIKRLFRNCRIIGRRFRLAHVYFQNGKIIEVATFRALDEQDPETSDVEQQDLLIRDDNVFGTPEEDALRRDFTINSLFYDLGDETVLDHADGLGDLRRKLVRTIGDPDTRFREDPIRILRAIKFAARLDFTIEKGTLESLRRNRGELNRAAMPRVLEELNRFCRGEAARRSFELMDETGVFDVVFHEIASDYPRERRELMFEIFGRMDDVRGGDAREIRSGEIFAAVLLPLVGPLFGWNRDGTAERPPGLNVRQVIDDLLRPMALRLRVPRREQEHCRQVLATLFRMVPVGRPRRNTKRAILNRECLPDALWMLRLLADRMGHEFEAAHAFWSAGHPESEETAADETGEAPRPRRRRRRSRRRSTGSDARRSQERGSRENDRKPAKAPQPARWDDDSFFAALPSAPEIAGGNEIQADRSGAAVVVPEGLAEPAAGTETGPESRPKRRRRRRRRRPPASGSADEKPGGDE
jgi:poly(A) polymerase